MNFCKFTNETRLAIEDASAHSGIKFLAALERHLRRRRLRARARVRRDPARRRRELRGQPAGDAAARRAARHRRPDARRRQAQGAARSRGRLRHGRRRREGKARGRVAAGRRGLSDEPVQASASHSACAGTGGGVRSSGSRSGHRAGAARRRQIDRRRAGTTRRCRLDFDRDKRVADADGRGPRGGRSRRPRRRSSLPAISSGRCARFASWTTRCCGCGSTSR